MRRTSVGVWACITSKVVVRPTATQVTQQRPLSRKPFSQIHDPNKPWEHWDTIGHQGQEEQYGAGDALQDAPESLFDEEVQEMSSTEVNEYIHQLVSTYDRHVYIYLTIPTVDLVYILHKRNLVPKVHGERAISAWFGDPIHILRRPQCASEWMGNERWRVFCVGIDDLLDEISPVMALQRVCDKHDLPHEPWMSFLRQMSLELLLGRGPKKLAMEQLASFFVAIVNNRGPAELRLPASDKERIILLANLLLGVAQESGNAQLAFTALNLQRAHHVEVSYAQQRALMNVAATSTRRSLDWDLRMSGQMKNAAVEWMSKYFPAVNNGHSMSQWSIEDAETSQAVGRGSPEPTDEGGAEAVDGEADAPAAGSIMSVSNIHHYFTIERGRDSEGVQKRKEAFATAARELHTSKEARQDVEHARQLVKASLSISDDAGKTKVVPSTNVSLMEPTGESDTDSSRLSSTLKALRADVASLEQVVGQRRKEAKLRARMEKKANREAQAAASANSRNVARARQVTEKVSNSSSVRQKPIKTTKSAKPIAKKKLPSQRRKKVK